MKSSFIAAALAAGITITSTASAQPAYGSSTSVRLAETLVGAAAGATVAVLLWPPAAPATATIGALIGGAVGYFEFDGAFQSAGGD